MNIITPYCETTEQSLLGACMVGECSPPCSPDDFYSERHKLIASAMQDIERGGGTPDLTILAEYLTGKVPASYLAEIYGGMASSENAERYAEIVHDYAVCRRAQMMAAQFVEAVSKRKDAPGKMAADFAAELIRTIEVGKVARETSIKQLMSQYVQDLDHRMREKSAIGYQTGLSRLDHYTCGMCRQDYWILAARPSMGKTALALQIVARQAKEGRKCLIFSLDMRAGGLIERFMSSSARVNLHGIRSGQLDNFEYGRVSRAAEQFYDLPITIIDTPCTEIDILRKTRKHNPDLIVVDFLQKVRCSKRGANRNEDMGNISRMLKDLAKDQDCPVLVLSQLNRSNEKEARRPQDSDLRESGDIEQDADVILFLHAKSKIENKRELLLNKNRQGEVAIMETIFNGAYQTFHETTKEE